MRKTTAKILAKRTENYQIALVGKGILVGVTAGSVVLAYRILLSYAGEWLNAILDYVRGNPIRMAFWLLVLAVLAMIVGTLVKWESMISGSGIPQLEGEMTGKIDEKWWRVLLAKFAGGFLSLLAGLSLGREGPSIQLGAMVGKGLASGLDEDKTEEKILMTCGASAGLSAAFHAPLAGIMFSLEEVHKNFSTVVLVSAMASSLTADFISTRIIGLDPVFDLNIGTEIAPGNYWIILILGVLLGALGTFYNFFTLKVQSLFKKMKRVDVRVKLLIPFLLAGILGFVFPSVLGSGHALVEQAATGEFLLHSVLLILVVKFLFSAVSFGSGAPGGIFFPLLVLGSLIGAAYALFGAKYLGFNPEYLNNIVLLSMAGYFTAIVRAPLTGIILIFEMTGSVSQLLSLACVSIVAYVVANLLRSKPIYESLLERLLENQPAAGRKMRGERILLEIPVMTGSVLDGKTVGEMGWPAYCLIVAIGRGMDEIIPKGDTKMEQGDMLVVMTDEKHQAYVKELMDKLCTDE